VHARRYEDNGDAVTNLVVIAQKTDKSAISGYGSPEKFLNEFNFLLGKQTFAGGDQTVFAVEQSCCFLSRHEGGGATSKRSTEVGDILRNNPRALQY